jgi:hypothetical protein
VRTYATREPYDPTPSAQILTRPDKNPQVNEPNFKLGPKRGPSQEPLNQMTAAIPLIIGIADFSWQLGDLTFTGIALGSIAALVVYHGMRLLGWRGRT